MAINVDMLKKYQLFIGIFSVIFDQGLCFRERKILMAFYFLGSFLGFPTVIPFLFTPEHPLPPPPPPTFPGT